MKIAVTHLKRYKEIASLLWRHGRSDLIKQMGIDDAIDRNDAATGAEGSATPEQLADDLEAMGPTYVKLGQVLSSRSDLLPEPYLAALSRLQDKVRPFSYEQVEEIVSRELGVRLSKAFSRFDRAPLAAASLGQVHLAALRDGRAVVVKVQRPDIRKQIADDFEGLNEIADFIDSHTEAGHRYRFLRILEEFRLTIQQELNYEREAQNLITVGQNLREFPLILVPQPIVDYSTQSVLTMDYVRGLKLTQVGPIVRLDVNGCALAEEVFKAYLKQVLVDGIFHADPHPGNVFLTDDGRIALLDLGMVGHVAPAMQESLLKLLLATSDRDSDAVSEIVIRISETAEEFNGAEFRRRIGHIMALRHDQPLKQLNVGRSLLEVSRSAAENGLFVPSELTLLAKTLLQLDEVGKILDPAFDPDASIRRNVTDLMSRRMDKTASQGSLFSSLLEAKEFVTGLPARLNRIMDAVSNHEIEVRVKAVDSTLLLEGFQKIANRITTGLVLAALIVGAALLMRVDTTFKIAGYPGFAMLCFIAAASGGGWLIFSIFKQDAATKQKAKLKP
jgi:predicted unusual protein kinase regulating ubiquinone biosynthesis (AarF/ABC1/UbiB family)